MSLRYFQDGGGMTVQVRVAREGGAPEPLSSAALAPAEVSYGGFLLRRTAPAGGAALAVVLFVASGAGGRRLWLRWQTKRATRRIARALATAGRLRVAVALIVAVGALVRALMTVGSGVVLWPDSDVFLYTVQQILRGEFLAHDAFRTLIYPYFLAAFLWWGETPAAGTAIVAAQHALGLAAAWLFYRVGREVVGRRAALVAALVFSLHPLLLFYEASVLTEALFVFAVSLFAVSGSALLRAPTAGRAILVGIMSALLTLVRPVGQGIALAVALPLWCAGLRPRRALALTGLVAAANLVAILPWMAVNQQQYGFFGVATGRGLGLFTRVFEIDRLPPSPVSAFPDVARGYEPVQGRSSSVANLVLAHLRANHHYSTRQSDDAMYGFALEAIRQHPARFAWNSLIQWGRQIGTTFGDVRTCASETGPYLCSGRMIGEARAAFPDAAHAGWPLLRRHIANGLSRAQVRMEVIWPLALLGLVAFLAAREGPADRRAVGLMLAALAAYLTLVPALTQWPVDRYRLPADAVLFLFAARGAAEVMALWGAAAPRGLRA